MRLKLSECSFEVRTAKMLCHVIGGRRLKPSSKPFAGIRKLVQPSSDEKLMGFEGLTNFSAAFADRVAETAPSLYEVLKRTRSTKKTKHG